jgi:hypothetical protein
MKTDQKFGLVGNRHIQSSRSIWHVPGKDISEVSLGPNKVEMSKQCFPHISRTTSRTVVFPLSKFSSLGESF